MTEKKKMLSRKLYDPMDPQLVEERLKAMHPMDSEERASGLQFAEPIVIREDVWIGGSVEVCPGVSIGDRSIIGAGRVVTRDIPADVFAAGNPCRVI